MNCPTCHKETKVIDSRVDEQTVRRRRECIACQTRFTTYERIELSITVQKRNGRTEPYSRIKLLDGLRRAGKNRTIVLENSENIVARIEHKLMQLGDTEVTSKTIGEFVMDELRAIDPVAYLRFTSVCRSFENVESFSKELERLSNGGPPGKILANPTSNKTG